MNIVKQLSTATSGTVTATPNTGQDIILFHNAVSLAITLTVAFPSSPIDAQKFTITSTLGVTTLTLSAGVTILNALTTLVAGGFGSWVYEASSNKWYRIS